MNDPRYQAIYDSLNRLNIGQLYRIKTFKPLAICLDNYNYDEEYHRFCPLAIGVGLHLLPDIKWTNYLCIGVLDRLGFAPYNLKGVEGNFYHGNHDERWRDLMLVVNRLIGEKSKC